MSFSSAPQNAVSANGVGAVTDAQLNVYVQSDTNAAMLRSFIGISGMSVMLAGIAAPGDGLGGLFYWSNGTGYVDDNENTIVPNGAVGQGAWLRAGIAGVTATALSSPPPIGNVTPNSGAFTTLTVTSVASGSGFAVLFASPPAIGTNAPATGQFTGLTATGTVSGAGFTNYLASPPAIGVTAPNAVVATTITASGLVSLTNTGISLGVAGNAVFGSLSAGGAQVTIGNTSGVPSAYLELQGPAGTPREIEIVTGSALRWLVGGDATAEGGSNAGTNFVFTRCTDAGSVIDTPVTINRQTGLVTFEDAVAIIGSVTPSQTNGIVGTTTNNNVNAGSVGEVKSVLVSTSPGVSLSTGSPANVATMPLTAGDWDVYGTVVFAPGGSTTITALAASISATTAALGDPTAGINQTLTQTQATITTGDQQALNAGVARFSLAAPASVYLVGQASFGASTMVAGGNIWARRPR